MTFRRLTAWSEQVNALLADESWWSIDRRAEAAHQFDSIAVSVFFQGIESGRVSSKDQRQSMIPLPTPEEGYARVMLLGSTGAGKTTLLRQFIGSGHKREPFPRKTSNSENAGTADI